jgi:cell division protein FtsB
MSDRAHSRSKRRGSTAPRSGRAGSKRSVRAKRSPLASRLGRGSAKTKKTDARSKKAPTKGTARRRSPATKTGRLRLHGVGSQGHRIPVALAALVALVILGTSFPFSGLFSQHSQLSATSSQLQSVQNENRLLSEQEQQLNTQTDIGRLARQYYQMVMPGQTLFDVLPASRVSASQSAASTPGDPANQPLVEPSKAPDMTPDPGLASSVPPAGSSPSSADGSAGSSPSGKTGSSSSGSAPSSFWSRIANSVEFWK